MYDAVPDGRSVEALLGLCRGHVRLVVDPDPPEAPQVVERRARVELAEQGLEVELEKMKDEWPRLRFCSGFVQRKYTQKTGM